MGRDTQTGTHRAFLSENLQLPFSADSTGHRDAIHKPSRTGLFSAKTSNFLFWRTRPASGVRYANWYTPGFPQQTPPTAFCGLDRVPECDTKTVPLGQLKSVPLAAHLTSSLFTLHYSLKNPPAGRFFSCPPGFFRFSAFFVIFIFTFIYVSSILSYRQISM